MLTSRLGGFFVTTHLEELLVQLRALAPNFGRAEKDIQAIASRASTDDYRGVLQNTRLVVETLLRAIIAKKKETPGKQTLEKLIVKLQHDLPTHIQVHVRTIQAWGNVSAHDHSAELTDDGLEVGKDEAVTAINSLVVILNWYQSEHLADAPVPSIPSAPAQSAPATPAAAAPPTSKVPLIAGAVLVLAAIGGGVWMAQAPKKDATATKPAEPPQNTVSDDAWSAAYAAQGEALPPVKPESCRLPPTQRHLAMSGLKRLVDGVPLAQRAKLVEILEGKQEEAGTYGEYWALLARARWEAGTSDEQVLQAIEAGLQSCRNFAVLHNVKGKLHMRSGDKQAAASAFGRAIELDGKYIAPQLNLGLVRAGEGKFAEAQKLLDNVIAADAQAAEAYQARGAVRLVSGDAANAVGDLKKATELKPDDGQAFFLLGKASSTAGDTEAASKAFCRAKVLGHKPAAALCPN